MKKPAMLPFSLVLTIALFLTGLLVNGCKDKEPESISTAKQSTTDSTRPDKGPDTTGLPPFDGSNAYNHVVKQVGFGPRNPNSEGHRKTLEYLATELGKYTDQVTRQSWTHDGYNGEKLELTNIIASFNPKATQRYLLVAHWDTRPRAEQDPDSAQRDRPIPGANDAGSGVGVLLELARIMKDHPPQVGIDIVLVDGEDYGRESDLDSYFLGARYFARNLAPGFKPTFGILLDMVGDRNASFAMEANSLHYAPDVVRALWNAARDLGLHQFKQMAGPAISDDHIPLNEAGIPTIDIIDADLVGNNTNDLSRHYWHTSQDTPDKVSSETLGAVGRLLVYMIYKMAPASGTPS
jgi:hypothetical protein